MEYPKFTFTKSVLEKLSKLRKPKKSKINEKKIRLKFSRVLAIFRLIEFKLKIVARKIATNNTIVIVLIDPIDMLESSLPGPNYL